MSDDATRGRWHGRRPAAMGLKIAGFAVAGVVGVGIFALAFGWLVMILWNWIMPTIFNLPLIGYWQGFGIVILAKLIFGGIGAGRHWGPGRHRPGSFGPGSFGPGGHGPGGWHGPGRDWRLWREWWEAEGRRSFDHYAEGHTPGAESGPPSGQQA